MRSCPQCNSRFDEEYFFCLNDGARLNDDAGEQITFVAPAVARRACPSCGAGNESGAAFCSKCGAAVSGFAVGASVATTPRAISAMSKRENPATTTPLPSFLSDAADLPADGGGLPLLWLIIVAALIIMGIALIGMVIDNSS